MAPAPSIFNVQCWSHSQSAEPETLGLNIDCLNRKCQRNAGLDSLNNSIQNYLNVEGGEVEFQCCEVRLLPSSD